MKNLKIAIASVLTTSVLFSGSVLAELGAVDELGVITNVNINENDEITLGFNHPQSLSVSSPNNVTERETNGVINRTWHVVSNNAVTVQMTGDSPDASGTLTGTPTFYKAEVGADGSIIANRFDHLVTTYGATIAGFNDITGVATFGAGAVADTDAIGISAQTDGQNPTGDYASVLTGTPATLIGSGGTSLNGTFGTIMPSDAGRFEMTISAKGIGDVATTQSGDYQVTLVAQFMANELGTRTVSAVTAESATATTGFLTDTLFYGTLTADNEQNTQWNVATSTSTDTDGTTVEQSAQIISDTASDTDATLAEVNAYAITDEL
jgi:hypothetical protein